MSSFTNSSEFHATQAVNVVLSKVLPGMKKIQPGKDSKKNKSNGKGSKAQLIDHNLKKRVELQQVDSYKIKKKEKIQNKNKLKHRQLQLQKLEKEAKLQVLKNHKENNTLTEREEAYLEKLAKRTTKNASSWDLEDDDKEESLELQEYILKSMASNKNHVRSKKRRNKGKQFKEEIKNSNNVSDHRYPGLTPGLAPVGLSDEEESSDEEKNVDY